MNVGSKSIDFVAAIITGLGVWMLNVSSIPSFLRSHLSSVLIEEALVKVASFVLAALVVSIWRHHLRARYGWVLIACLGIVTTAVADELALRANNPEPEFFAAFSPFPMEILLFGIPALVLMAVVHYGGLLLMLSKHS